MHTCTSSDGHSLKTTLITDLLGTKVARDLVERSCKMQKKDEMKKIIFFLTDHRPIVVESKTNNFAC